MGRGGLSFGRVGYLGRMRFAADLHVHSRFSEGVSPAMTLENIAVMALRKGVDLLGTGDCLQPEWLAEIEAHTVEAEPGLRRLSGEAERAVRARVPAALWRPLRFILSTEVNCAPLGTEEIRGLHQLLFFPSVAVVREFAARVGKLGDLQAGRPTLRLSAEQLLRGTRQFDRVYQAAAHAMNPWFSVFGVIGGERALETVYGAELPHLLAVETGLTSDPAMGRRVPGLDAFGLFSCSDAHSLENVGRECTLLEVEPDYDAVMAALRPRSADRVVGTIKFPFRHTRYYLNWCSTCRAAFDAQQCPRCDRALTMGARDRLERLEGVRPAPQWPESSPPFEALDPLAYVIAAVEGRRADGESARRAAADVVDRMGHHERFILTEATVEALLAATSPEIAGAILAQRTGAVSQRCGSGEALGQAGFDF